MVSSYLHYQMWTKGIGTELPTTISHSINHEISYSERAHRWKFKWRFSCLKIILGIFFLSTGGNSFAQNGNSCSNPFVMNLSNGETNHMYNLNSSDSLLYIKVTGIANKMYLELELDSLSLNYYIKDLRVTTNNCNNEIIIAQRAYFARFKTINNNVNFVGIDTALIVLSIARLTDSLSYQNTIDINVKLKNINGNTSAPCVNPIECNNLLPNGSFEEFNPPSTNFNQIGALSPFFTNYVCNWDDVDQSTIDYFNPWFNGDCYLFAPANICNPLGFILNSLSCGYPAQGSDFFANSTSYSALQFGDNGLSGGGNTYLSEILKGELPIALVAGKRYYMEVDVAKPRRLYYGGRLDFNLSDEINFIQSNYTSSTNVSLSIDAFDHDPSLTWKKANTIYQSNSGGEKYLYIGNLRLSPINPMLSASGFPICSQFGDAVYYLFDNIVVKEFFADAGNSSITICPGSEIGGSSCEFPNGTYEWLPANLFNNNTLFHPTFIGTSSANVSLTVSIVMEDGTTQVSDPSYVNITVTSPNVTISGATSVISGNSTTLTANGATYYIWTDANGNNIPTTGSGAILETGILTQQQTFTVTGFEANGCSSTAIITIDVILWPALCAAEMANMVNVVPIPNGNCNNLIQYLINNYPANITNIGPNAYEITSTTANPINFSLAGSLVIPNGTILKFNASLFLMNFICFDGSEIINFGNLEMERCSLMACNNMWKGIQNNLKISMNMCWIADAEYGIHLKHGSNYNINTSFFSNNLYGILMGGINGGQIMGVDYSNIFTNPNPLKQPYAGMQNYVNRAEAGIKVMNVYYTQIGSIPIALPNNAAITAPNFFQNINCGINIFNSNVRIINSRFRNITPLNLSPAGTLIGLQPEGSGVYARSTGTPKSLSIEPIPGSSGNEFENCKFGIQTFRNSISASSLRMSDVACGINAQNAMMCNYDLEFNKINALLTGININNAEFANNIVVAYNQIKMNFLMGYFGINVTGAVNGNTTNLRITNNIVTISNAYNAGIQTSAINGAVVSCNTIKKTLTNPFMSWYSLSGIKSLDCDNVSLSNNTISWMQGFSSTPNAGIDYLVQQSNQAFINCNSTGVSKIGLQISGTNNNSTLRANKFGNNNIALYYDNTGVTGPQPANPAIDPTEGNRWIGTNTYKAYNAAFALGPNFQNSIYYVNPIQPSIYVPQPQFVYPQGWFDNGGLSDYQPSCLIYSCAERRHALIGNSDYYHSIANRSLITNGYPEQTLWMAQNFLVSLLRNDSTLLNNDDSLNYFYYSPDARNLRDIDAIKEKNNGNETQRNLFVNAITANDSLMAIVETQIVIVNGQLADTTAIDSLLFNQKINLLAQYYYLKQINDSMTVIINNYHLDNLTSAKNLNKEFEPRNANETILKTVNEIYYTLRENEYNYISFDDSTMLAYIVHLCPLAAGPAVFRARDMYALLVDSVLYQDSAVCNREGYAREGLNMFKPKININETENSFFNVYPVPAQNILNIKFNELKSNANLSLFDMNGKLILSKPLAAGTKYTNLDLSAVMKGVYSVLLINNERINRTKISIIK